MVTQSIERKLRAKVPGRLTLLQAEYRNQFRNSLNQMCMVTCVAVKLKIINL